MQAADFLQIIGCVDTGFVVVEVTACSFFFFLGGGGWGGGGGKEGGVGCVSNCKARTKMSDSAYNYV